MVHGARSRAAAVVVVLAALRGASGQGSMEDAAERAGFSTGSALVSAQTRLRTSMASARTEVASSAKSTAHGLGASAKRAFCGAFAINMLCEEDAEPACSGPGCCPASSCYSNSIPGMRCDGSRGETTCVGSKLFVKAGVCQCKSGGCSTAGRCAGGGDDFSGLYEEGDVVTRKDLALPLFVLLGSLGSAFVLGCGVASRRVRHRPYGVLDAAAPTADAAAALVEDEEDSDAVE